MSRLMDLMDYKLGLISDLGETVGKEKIVYRPDIVAFVNLTRRIREDKPLKPIMQCNTCVNKVYYKAKRYCESYKRFCKEVFECCDRYKTYNQNPEPMKITMNRTGMSVELEGQEILDALFSEENKGLIELKKKLDEIGKTMSPEKKEKRKYVRHKKFKKKEIPQPKIVANEEKPKFVQQTKPLPKKMEDLSDDPIIKPAVRPRSGMVEMNI